MLSRISPVFMPQSIRSRATLFRSRTVVEYTDEWEEEERRRRLEGWMSAQPLSMRRLERSDREVAMLAGE